MQRSVIKPVQAKMRIPVPLHHASEFELVMIRKDGSEWAMYSHYPNYEMVKRIFDDAMKDPRDGNTFEIRGYA